MTFHVQVMGQGPAMLLLHGTGASTHSFRDLLPRLAPQFTVVAPDLPGHAFTQTPATRRMSLPGMASALGLLLRQLRIEPRIAVGHSAGAAIIARMSLDGLIHPAGLISLNGALRPIGGVAGQVFSPLAKAMASTSLVPRLLARWADDGDMVKRFLGQTGSTIDPAGLALYRRLLRDHRHAAGALSMMANWDVASLMGELRARPLPLVLAIGSRDRSVPPDDAYRLRDRVPGAIVETLRDLGHLAHEEAPDLVAALILAYAGRWGVLPATATEARVSS